MLRPRIIPTLLLRNQGLVKGIKFKDYRYVGDPMNAVKIFNDKEVDELLFLDITATMEKRGIDLELVQKIADECYMPFSVGGGIRTIEEMRDILSAGAEKISINTSAVNEPSLISKAADVFGSQSVILSVDFKKTWLGKYKVFTHSGTVKTSLDPLEWAKKAASLGSGEIYLNSIDRDGTMEGYDLDFIKAVSRAVKIPVIAAGGAGNLEDFSKAIHQAGAAAVSAGSLFVFHGKRRAVLISYPGKKEIEKVINSNI